MGDIFREIDDELRQERLEKLWRKYGRYVIVAAVAAVIAVAAVSGWKEYRKSQNIAAGERFAAAKSRLIEGKTNEAAALFAKLAEESDTAYGTLARFHQAALRAKSGDAAGAIALYDALAADSDVSESLRGVAVILSALQAVNQPSPDAESLKRRLEPLTAANNPWRHSALEILALLSHKTGDVAKAREYFQQIADDVDAPQGMRGRATQMLAVIGS